MLQTDALVVGGGPAGVAAATELVSLGMSVILTEQRDRLGGAIYRAYTGQGDGPLALAPHHCRAWCSLQQGLSEVAGRVSKRFETVFLGVDSDGICLLDDRHAGRVVGVRAKAIVLAVGALERINPRPGWELPGVTTAGAVQVQLKETGEPPVGPILVAGSGPLLLALAAQLTLAGNPPLAVLEQGSPLRAGLIRPWRAFSALRSRDKLSEALSYGSTLWHAGVAYRSGWAVTAIQAAPEGLIVTSKNAKGCEQQVVVRHLALHDGLVCNDNGLPGSVVAGVHMVRAGDCREVLGAQGAILDGQRAARQAARLMGGDAVESGFDKPMAAIRRSQQAMIALCTAPPVAPPPETVLCRCEGLRRADLDALPATLSPREVRLVGRFGMGACQGRFCTHNVNQLMSASGTPLHTDNTGEAVARWPLRPVSVAALAAYREL